MAKQILLNSPDIADEHVEHAHQHCQANSAVFVHNEYIRVRVSPWGGADWWVLISVHFCVVWFSSHFKTLSDSLINKNLSDTNRRYTSYGLTLLSKYIFDRTDAYLCYLLWFTQSWIGILSVIVTIIGKISCKRICLDFTIIQYFLAYFEPV